MMSDALLWATKPGAPGRRIAMHAFFTEVDRAADPLARALSIPYS
jgi:hypothetical protein